VGVYKLIPRYFESVEVSEVGIKANAFDNM
jgi:hypothetical protein